MHDIVTRLRDYAEMIQDPELTEQPLGIAITAGLLEEAAREIERLRARWARGRILPEGYSCVEGGDDELLISHPNGKRISASSVEAFKPYIVGAPDSDVECDKEDKL